jgi:5-methylcytosine-specific restriction endonuclease McrA
MIESLPVHLHSSPLPRNPHDSPYSDEHRSSRSKARPHSGSSGHHTKESASSHKPRKTHARQAGQAAAKPLRPGKKRRRRGKGGGTYKAPDELTSHPTSRNAQVETRAWLLKQYGSVCAYCGSQFSARHITLDHVAPRRGQTAYDRRDNLVLSCRGCNAAKRDLAPLAFLLGLRSRAANLLKFGAHLSHGLLDLARSLMPGETPASSGKDNIDFERWDAPTDPDEDSPYRD